MTRGHLPRAYLRFDPNVDQTHPDSLGDFFRLLCAANRQPHRGRFRNRETLIALFGKAVTARFYARGDVLDLADGRAYVQKWDEWQEGDLTVGDRMSRLRNTGVTSPLQERNGSVSGGVTLTVTNRITPSEASRRLGVEASDSTGESSFENISTDVPTREAGSMR